MKAESRTIKELTVIPGIGKSIAKDLIDIGINHIDDLKGKNAEQLYNRSNKFVGNVQDRCLLYAFRCAIYFAEGGRDSRKLKWWNWKDNIGR
jgi:nucleotidyltransferase/DNA polymerase involved in DNA repair